MSDIDQGKGFLVAAAVGAAVGAGVALLLAPHSGKETRGWLIHKSREMKDRAKSTLENGKEAIRRDASAHQQSTGH